MSGVDRLRVSCFKSLDNWWTVDVYHQTYDQFGDKQHADVWHGVLPDPDDEDPTMIALALLSAVTAEISQDPLF